MVKSAVLIMYESSLMAQTGRRTQNSELHGCYQIAACFVSHVYCCVLNFDCIILSLQVSFLSLSRALFPFPLSFFSSSLLLNNYILVENLLVAACCWLKWKQSVRRQDDGSQCQRQSYHHLA